MNLEAVLSPELVSALEQLVDERVEAALSEHESAGTPWLSIDEAAEYAKVSARTLERAIARGRLRSSPVGRRRILHRDDVDRYLRAATGEDVAPTTPSRRRTRRLDVAGEEA